MEIAQAILIGSEDRKSDDKLGANEAVSGVIFGPRIYEADNGHVEQACFQAAWAFAAFRDADPEQCARLLEDIIDSILDLGDPLIACAIRKTGLPRARLEGRILPRHFIPEKRDPGYPDKSRGPDRSGAPHARYERYSGSRGFRRSRLSPACR